MSMIEDVMEKERIERKEMGFKLLEGRSEARDFQSIQSIQSITEM